MNWNGQAKPPSSMLDTDLIVIYRDVSNSIPKTDYLNHILNPHGFFLILSKETKEHHIEFEDGGTVPVVEKCNGRVKLNRAQRENHKTFGHILNLDDHPDFR